jgi:nitronate monooxygenase
MLSNRFTLDYGLRAPIMQAPMGGVAGPELVAAVCNAGALGALPIWLLSVDMARDAVASTRSMTDGPFAVNVRADLPQAEHVAAAVHAGAPIVHLFWGTPRPLAAAVRASGATLAVTVANDDEARQALDAGATLLIAQGWEAGGHVRGTITTLALVPTIVDLAGDVPVLAAGGIADGRALAAVLMLGAAGAVIGTRFAASTESRAHPAYKQALLSARQADAVYVPDLFDVGWPGAPHRVLRNETMRAWEAAGCPASGQRPGEGETIGKRADGRIIPRYSVAGPMVGYEGEVEAMAMYAGQGVDRVREIERAAETIGSVVNDAVTCLRRGAVLAGN